ncbi:hypothetical protein [Lysinibacillus fusiformis]|uniref:hypothetical protein n=1 Tax=Lysinibacillus fusiformis TaxID=28031 RepID=UPI0037F55FCF
MTSDKWAKIILFVSLIFFAIAVGFEISNVDLKNALITLAQLNVAISVGIGALSIGVIKNKVSKNSLAEVTVAISGLSLLTFLIAHLEIAIISRLYLVANILIICSLLFLTLIETENKKQSPQTHGKINFFISQA